MRTLRLLALTVCLAVLVSGTQPRIAAVDAADTKLLAQPAIAANHIAFIYAGDLYSADLNGASC